MFDSQRYRRVVSLLLAIAAVLIVGCSPAPEAKPVYSPEQIDLIGQYQSDLESLRTRIDELPALIDFAKWSDIQSLIHGPLGDLRFKMLTIARNLAESDEKKARDLSGDVFKYLVNIDQAAANQNKAKAFTAYDNLVNAYERFINTIPQEPTYSAS